VCLQLLLSLLLLPMPALQALTNIQVVNALPCIDWVHLEVLV
jgi:hypothetical protein